MWGGTPFVHQDVEADDRPADIAGKVFDRTIATLMSVRNALSADQIEHGIRLLAGARRIEFYGCGNSGIVALDIQHKFFRLGIPTTAYSDPHVFSMSAALLRRAMSPCWCPTAAAHGTCSPPPRWHAAAAPACWR
jgi:RpiR family carbohydrate utilization transcriptional regulator